MALISGFFALVGRFAGRLVDTSLGWATVLLFGKVSSSRQTILSFIALGALAWVVALVGIFVPAISVFLLSAVPILPSFVDQTWIRVAMVAVAVALPLLIGFAAVAISDKERRPKGGGLIVGVLRGYPFTLLLALTMGLLSIVSIIRKAVSLAKRHEVAHVPFIVKPGGYDAVMNDLESVLEQAQIDVDRKPAPRILSVPPRLLAKIAGPSLGALVPDRLMRLNAPDLDILVYPSDLAIEGTKLLLARARAAIAVRLTEAPAYMTTSAEAEKVEDEIRRVADRANGVGGPKTTPLAEATIPPSPGELRRKLAAIDEKLASLTVDFDEWETLYRERLQVERDLLTRGAELGVAGIAPAPRSAPKAEIALGLTGIALVVLDLVMVVVNRLRPGRQAGR
jgi:hypothetical protein